MLADISPLMPPIMPIAMGTAKFFIADDSINCIVAVTNPPRVPLSIQKNIWAGGKPSRDITFPDSMKSRQSHICVMKVIKQTIKYLDKNMVEYLMGLVYIYCRQLLKFS